MKEFIVAKKRVSPPHPPTHPPPKKTKITPNNLFIETLWMLMKKISLWKKISLQAVKLRILNGN